MSGRPGPIWRIPLAAGVAFAALVLVGCESLFPDVEDWIADSETLARRFDARLGDLQECLEEDDCGEVLDSDESVFAMCSWVGSRGELAPERFEAAEWPRFDGLCEGLEGVLAMPRADALRRIDRSTKAGVRTPATREFLHYARTFGWTAQRRPGFEPRRRTC